MTKTAKFLKECKHWWIVTNNGMYPSARPFGALMVWKERLYMPTNRNKKVYKQLIFNNHVCIVAIKPGKREWIRMTADAKISHDISLKKRMWNQNPVLQKIYGSFENDEFQLLEFHVRSKEIHLD